MNNHQLLENLVPNHYSNYLIEEFAKIAWGFTPSAANVGDNYDHNDPNILDSVQFVQGIAQDNKPMSTLFQTVVPILWFFEKDTGHKIKSILRIKANCLVRDGFEVKYQPPHIDVYEPGFHSLIYYINDSDGDTIVFDHIASEGHTNLNIIDRVTPKQGNALFIPSNRFHSSSCPIDTRQRMVINFVLELE
jgi:hypothetical protein